MKKIMTAFVLSAVLFAGCDNVNMNIDDLPRTLRISVKTLNDTNDKWDLIEDSHLDVTSGSGALTGTIGNITVTPAQNSYIRSNSVTVIPATNGVTDLVFAYWLLPSRSTLSQDPLSTEGNIRYDDLENGETVSLRTNSVTTEMIAAFAHDGTVSDFNGPLVLTNEYVDSNTTLFLFDLVCGSNITVYNPQYRIFDDLGEARTDWLDFYNDSNNDTVIFPSGTNSFQKSLSGIIDQGVLDSWKVVILYEDSSGDVYVVK